MKKPNYKKAPKYKKMAAGGPFEDSGGEGIMIGESGGGGSGGGVGNGDGAESNAIGKSTLAALGLGQSLMEKKSMDDTAGQTILERTSQGASAGSFGGATGMAIGAAAGLVIGGTEAIIEADKRRKATRKANFELQQSLRDSIRDSKFAAGDSFSLDENPLNSINGIDEVMDNKKRKAVAKGMAAQYLAKGGKVVGPGGPKDDKIKAKLKKGSFVVPAENAKVAEVLRKSILGDDTKTTDATKSGVNVMLSNGEHLFTPSEVKKITAAGINLDALAPEAEEQLNPGVKLAKGLKVDTDKKWIEAQKKAVIASMVKKGVPASKAEKYVNSTKDSYLLNQSKEKFDAAVAELKKRTKNYSSFETNINNAKTTAELKEVGRKAKALLNDEEFSNLSKKIEAKSSIVQKQEVAAGNSKRKNDIVSEFLMHEFAFNDNYNKAKRAFDAVNKNPENYKADQIEAVKNNFERYETANKSLKNLPRDNPYSLDVLKGKQFKGLFSEADVKKAKEKSSNNSIVAPKTASIPVVSLTDPAVAVPGTTPTIPKKTGTATGTSKTKKPTITIDSLKPVLPSEDDQLKAAEIDLTEIKKINAADEAKATEGTAPTATTTATAATGNPSPYKKKEVTGKSFMDSIGGPAGVAALGQMGLGLITSIGEERPIDSVSPELMTRYFDAVHDESQAEIDAKEGFSAAEWAKINSQIEANRVQTMNDIVSSGGAGNASQLRALSTDKNKALIDAKIASEGVKLQKKQFAIGVSSRADQMGAAIDQRRRQIFTDNARAFEQTQEASADLINAGLGNFINNLAYQSLNNDKEKTPSLTIKTG